jgi:hypothetical protein
MRFLLLLVAVLFATPAFAQSIPHPAGCPKRAFCACGACVDLTGNPKACPWRARDWLKYPSVAPAPNTVAVRPGHVFVLKRHIGGKTWMVANYNGKNRRSMYSKRSIAGWKIVRPFAVAVAEGPTHQTE